MAAPLLVQVFRYHESICLIRHPRETKKLERKEKQEQGSTEVKQVATAVNHRKCTEAFWTAWFERPGRVR